MLAFDVIGARAPADAAMPTIAFDLCVRETAGARVEAIALRLQIQIETRKRHYTGGEMARLADLFGTPERWGETLQGVLWSHVAVTVPSFTGETHVDVPVGCTYDFEIAASKYFTALESGEVPLEFLFSGTVFAVDGARLSVSRVPWDLNATYRLPVAVWRDAMESHFPNSAWIRMHKDAFEELDRFRIARGLPSWEHAIGALLAQAKEPT